MKLPDGEELTEARKDTLERGYDHYWQFHKNESQWVAFCPVCKAKSNKAITHPQGEEMPKILKIILLLDLLPTAICMGLAREIEEWLEVLGELG